MTDLPTQLHFPQIPAGGFEDSAVTKYLEQLAFSLNFGHATLGDRVRDASQRGVIADRPPATGANKLYHADDEAKLYFDAGTWVEVANAHTHVEADITDLAHDPNAHTHVEADITDLVYPYDGCLLHRTSNYTWTSTAKDISWQSAIWNTGSFWDVSDNDELYLSAGRYRLRLHVAIANKLAVNPFPFVGYLKTDGGDLIDGCHSRAYFPDLQEAQGHTFDFTFKMAAADHIQTWIDHDEAFSVTLVGDSGGEAYITWCELQRLGDN